jgi:hypothetical protein
VKIHVIKNRVAFCLLAVLGLILAGCFQPVDIGETFIEEGTAHLRVTNDSEDDSYILEGFELRNAEGAAVWEGLDLKAGKSRDIHTETAGSYTLWYRVKDTWISETIVDFWEAGPVDIALNRSHDFSFKVGDGFKVTPRDEDRDGVPDIWETENGFDPKDNSDGGTVYVSANGLDEAPGNGTREQPYKTLAKAADKARRGLDDAACTVVVLGTLDWLNANDRNPENQARADSLFVLGKTRYPLIIRGEDLTDLAKAGVLKGHPAAHKRVLYIGPGADITLLNIKITGGKHTGGGIYVSGAKLTLGPWTTVTGNESYDVAASASGGIYMERGTLIMEADSSVTGNTANSSGGVTLVASTLTMNGGKITNNKVRESSGGLSATDSTIKMFAGAEISGNEVGAANASGNNVGGVALSYSTLIMYNGSKIIGNKVYGGSGGGLYTAGESFVTMEEGSEISGNECPTPSGQSYTGIGGGLHVGGMTTFTMKGGKITRNTAGNYGGGIDLSGVGTSFTMEGGEISGNTAGRIGGGIILSSGALLTIKGGTIYGSGDDTPTDKKNTATKGDSDNQDAKHGHAIWDADSGKIYDDNVTADNYPRQ